MSERMISYGCNGDDTVRFRQYAKDSVPVWATDIQDENLHNDDERRYHELDTLETELLHAMACGGLPSNKTKEIFEYLANICGETEIALTSDMCSFLSEIAGLMARQCDGKIGT